MTPAMAPAERAETDRKSVGRCILESGLRAFEMLKREI
jgi:hypothetical protein